MPQFISELIDPCGGSDTGAMSRGEPGLPVAFSWRGQRLNVIGCAARWKESSAEGGVGELYLRRHYFKLDMSDGTCWTVYFLRQKQAGAAAGARWFLYTID